MYSRTERQYSFAAAAQLVAVLADIPFDDPIIWKALITYAEKQNVDVASHMAHPHPSFVYPLLVDAFERINLPMSELSDPAQFERSADSLLKQMGLPPWAELRSLAQALSKDVEKELNSSPVAGPERAHVLAGLRDYEAGLSAAEKLLTPMKLLGDSLPVPVLFSDDAYWDGSQFSMSECQRLVGY